MIAHAVKGEPIARAVVARAVKACAVSTRAVIARAVIASALDVDQVNAGDRSPALLGVGSGA
ncbi:hypothetical protein [Streptomyces sp. NPDC088358]|uniref:hypothetical protein n=1 Tax=Streptomyces sp. NPDC088358 TaxID=3365857 RepID=UPI003806E90B